VDCWGDNTYGQAEDQSGPYGVYVPPADTTPPVITPDIQGTLGQNGWYTSDVTLSWTVSDAESEITATSGCEAVSITADQQDTTYTCEASSLGGSNSVSVHIARDATAPALAPSVEPDPVLLNGSACDPVDTAGVGAHSVACAASDNAGNTATAQAAYNVIYDFIGFSSPVDNSPVVNSANSGQAIPLKWRLLDAHGAPVTTLAGVTVTAVTLACSTGTTTDLIEEYTAGHSGLQNLADGYYQWNWKTPKTYAKSCKTLILNLGEGVGFEHTALFRFRK